MVEEKKMCLCVVCVYNQNKEELPKYDINRKATEKRLIDKSDFLENKRNTSHKANAILSSK